MTNATPARSTTAESGHLEHIGDRPHHTADRASDRAAVGARADDYSARVSMIGALRDVIDALDRRRSHRAGEDEQAIVRDAASMRDAAVARVQALEREPGTVLTEGHPATA